MMQRYNKMNGAGKMANASKIVRQCTILMRCKKTHINMRKIIV